MQNSISPLFDLTGTSVWSRALAVASAGLSQNSSPGPEPKSP